MLSNFPGHFVKVQTSSDITWTSGTSGGYIRTCRNGKCTERISSNTIFNFWDIFLEHGSNKKLGWFWERNFLSTFMLC